MAQPIQPHYPQRVRNELRFRQLTVVRSERISSAFQRVVLAGPQLQGFISQGFDDHIKVFFPEHPATFVPPVAGPDGIVWQNDSRPATRDYTPLFDEQRQELAIDFYLHDGGVASHWATRVQVGQPGFIGGPRGSLVVPLDYAWQLYVCDETGMPALRRRLATLSHLAPQVQVSALVMVHDDATKDYLVPQTGVNIEWVVGRDVESVARRLAALTLPEQDYFVWITGEGKVVKHLSQSLSHPAIDAQLLRAVAYWHDK